MTAYYLSKDGELIEMETFFKTPYNHDTCEDCLKTATKNELPSITQQHFKEEADINTIVDRFLKTGEMKTIPLPPQFEDVSEEEGDYHSLQNKIAETNALFYKLPAATRASFQNDPGKWVEHVNDELADGNLDTLKAMGLDVPTKRPEPTTPTEATPAPTGDKEPQTAPKT